MSFISYVERDEGIKIRFDLHAGQTKAWNSTKRFVLVCAGTQGGKTSFYPLWLYREIQERGPGDYLIVSPTYPLMQKKSLPEFRSLFENMLQLGRYVGGSDRVWTLNENKYAGLFDTDKHPQDGTPTRVMFGHAQDPESLESATAKAAVLDEAGQKKFKAGS